MRDQEMSSPAGGKKRVKLRPLKVADYEQMIECWNKSGLSVKVKGRESKDSIREELQFNGAFFIGAFDETKGERLVGLAIGNYDGRRGWINRIAVLPEYRREGVASTLISKAEEFLKKKGAKVIAALIDKSNNPSRKLFEKHGYNVNEEITYYAKRESPDS
jgi:ribosomal protein S18 acetylase RimI-like enzyme